MDLTLNEIKNELQISAELYESKRKALNTLDKIERLENTEKKIVALKAKQTLLILLMSLNIIHLKQFRKITRFIVPIYLMERDLKVFRQVRI